MDWSGKAPAIMGRAQGPSNQVGLLSMDDDDWEDDPEFADEFEPALWLINHHHDIRMDPSIDVGKTEAERLAQSEIGLLDYHWDGWSIYVNWQLKWSQTIPPHHMGVERNGRLVGIVSPYMTMRTCWNDRCREGDPSKGGGWNEDLYYIYMSEARRREYFLLHGMELAPRAPRVLPAHPCPKCNAVDWFGSQILNESGQSIASRDEFQYAAATAFARLTDEAQFAEDMSLVHDATGEGKNRHVSITPW